MFLELRGYDEPDPVITSEDPRFPGPTPLFMNTPVTSGAYPAMAGELVLPQSLFLPTGELFARAIQQVLQLYRDFQAGRKKAPEDVAVNYQGSGSQGMAAVNFAAIIAVGTQILNLILGAVQSVNAVQINARIQGMYNVNRYNVQQLLTMNGLQIANQIRQIDRDLEQAFANGDRNEAAALSQFRLIYQQRFDQVGGGLLRNWLPIVAIGAAAWYFLRRKR
jgi:hypothetical protein